MAEEKKKQQRYIAYKNLPPRFPVITAIVFGLLLDRLSAPEWVWGVVGSFLVLWGIGSVVQSINSRSVDIFKEEEE